MAPYPSLLLLPIYEDTPEDQTIRRLPCNSDKKNAVQNKIQNIWSPLLRLIEGPSGVPLPALGGPLHRLVFKNHLYGREGLPRFPICIST